jgi:hypothetical protein
MALMAIQNKQNRLGIIVFTDNVHLGQEDVSNPLNGDLVACPSIRRSDISPRANLLELPKEPLCLKVFAFENDAWVKIMTSGGDGVD